MVFIQFQLTEILPVLSQAPWNGRHWLHGEPVLCAIDVQPLPLVAPSRLPSNPCLCKVRHSMTEQIISTDLLCQNERGSPPSLDIEHHPILCTWETIPPLNVPESLLWILGDPPLACYILWSQPCIFWPTSSLHSRDQAHPKARHRNPRMHPLQCTSSNSRTQSGHQWHSVMILVP